MIQLTMKGSHHIAVLPCVYKTPKLQYYSHSGDSPAVHAHLAMLFVLYSIVIGIRYMPGLEIRGFLNA